MKKFQGRRVPKPRMKKMIHTALYLGNGQEEVHTTSKKLYQQTIQKSFFSGNNQTATEKSILIP